MSKSVENFDDIKNEMKKTSLDVVLKAFPQKICELDAMLREDPKFDIGFDVSQEIDIVLPEDKSDANPPNGEPSVKKRRFKNEDEEEDEENVGPKTCWAKVQSNRQLVDMIVRLKKELVEFVDYTLAINVGISLMQPQIEDGNNFGVEVQQEVIDATLTAENDAYLRIHEVYKYFNLRADQVIKLIKHSTCEDFRCAIRERDRMFHRFVRTSIVAVRNHYITLHDLFLKNSNKIKKPKSGVSSELLY